MRMGILSKPAILSGATLFVGLVAAAAWMVSFSLKDDGRIVSAVHLGWAGGGLKLPSCSLGQLTLEEAKRRLQVIADAVASEKVRLSMVEMPSGVEVECIETDVSSLGVYFDVDAVAKAAYEYGRQGSILKRLGERWMALRHSPKCSYTNCRFAVKPQFGLHERIAVDLLRRIKPIVELRPCNARVEVADGCIRIIKSKYGRRVDEVSTLLSWTTQLSSGELPKRVFLKLVRPQIATEDIAHINAIIGECVTRYSTRRASRAHNIRLAASAIDGKLILPGEVFSYNEAVGPRNLKRGYRVAPVLVRGEFRNDVGGGVCQVAGTLFNAALLAGLEIVERHRHSRPVDYLPIGMDATVDYGRIDLKLRNPYEHAVYIKATASNGKLMVLILGKHSDVRYKVKSELVKVLTPPVVMRRDPSLPVGRRQVERNGRAGYVSVVWRFAYKDGKLIRKELVCRDTYPPQPKIIRVGSPGSAVRPQDQFASSPLRRKAEGPDENCQLDRRMREFGRSVDEWLIDVREEFFGAGNE